MASHESINGDCKKLKDIFKENSYVVTEEERLEYINIYCSERLKKIIKNQKILTRVSFLLEQSTIYSVR